MADWSELPQEILHLVSQRLDNPFDLIHIRSVCSSWRSYALSRSRNLTLRCPLPPHEYRIGDHCLISRRSVYLLRSPPCDRPRYWLFKLREDENRALSLQNLFINNSYYDRFKCPNPSISLDLLNCRVSALEREHVACYSQWDELTLLLDEMEEPVGFMRLGEGSDEFAILGRISFNSLAVYRSVEGHWTVLDDAPGYFEAVASFKGKFYVVNRTEKTTIIKPSLEVSHFECSKPRAGLLKRGLLQSGDELYLLELIREDLYHSWHIPNDIERRMRFDIFRLDERRNAWGRVEDLGGRVVFFCHCSSFSCLASDLPGFKGNTIIFMDIWTTGGTLSDHIMVFDLTDRSLGTIKDIPEYLELFGPPPGCVISND